MRLTDLEIEQFGTWKGQKLSLQPRGLTVVHGSNGAGKSTLLQFIRSTLFGHDAASLAKAPAGVNSRVGTLWFEGPGGRLGLSRAPRAGDSPGDLSWETPGSPLSSPSLAECLGSVDRELFDGVFCLGLSELHELAALGGDQVGNHIFEASLDPTIRGLVKARAQSREDRSPVGLRGQIVTELGQVRSRLTQLAPAGERTTDRRFSPLQRELEELERQRHELSRRRARLERGRGEAEFRERCRGPQRELREIREQLASGASPFAFPATGLERLRELDELATTQRRQHRRWLRQLRQVRGAIPRTGLSAIDAAALAGFLAQREWFTEVARQRGLALEQFHAARLRWEQLKGEQAPGWTDASLAQLPRSAEVAAALSESADRLRRARWRHARLRKLWRSGRSRLSELTPVMSQPTLPTPPTEAMATVRSQLDAIPRAALLRVRESGLRERLRDLQRWATSATHQPGDPLPGWLSVGVSLFFFLAVLLAGWGLIAGVSVSAVAGLIYLFMGIAFGGLAWGLKTHFETHSGPDPVVLEQRHQQQSLLETELQSVRRDLQSADPRGATAVDDPLEKTRLAAAELARLAELAHVERHTGHLRQRFRRLTRHLRTARQQHRAALTQWHEQLTQLGLEPSDDPDAVLQSWSRLSAVAREQQQLVELARRGEVLGEIWRAVEADAAHLALRLPGAELKPQQLLQQVDHWRQLLADWQAERQETRAARTRGARLLRRLRRSRTQQDQCEAARQLLWRQAGVTDRAGFLAAAGHSQRRGELVARENELLAELTQLEQSRPAAVPLAPAGGTAQTKPLAPEHDSQAPPSASWQSAGLQALAAATDEPVPDDLEAIRELLRGLEAELSQLHQRHTTLSREFSRLAQQPDAEEAEFQRTRLHEREQELLAQLAGLDHAGEIFDQQVLEFEARHQPQTLEVASGYLRALSGGRYQRLWTALGERSLRVEDLQGESYPGEALSRGGREQLYLALRLALIERLHARGIEMPLLLDDVFSNFDEVRSDAAIDVLLDFARRGHQVIYITCHHHLARQFETRGEKTIWLSGSALDEPLTRRVG